MLWTMWCSTAGVSCRPQSAPPSRPPLTSPAARCVWEGWIEVQQLGLMHARICCRQHSHRCSAATR